PLRGGRGLDDRERLLKGAVALAPDGVRRRGAEPAGRESRRGRGMSDALLEIRNLHARAGDAEILRGVDLVIKPGEVHPTMGPNGSGKSARAGVLAGKPAFEVTAGQVLFDGRNLLDLAPEERALAGVFLAFQYPVEIPGVGNNYFLKA